MSSKSNKSSYLSTGKHLQPMPHMCIWTCTCMNRLTHVNRIITCTHMCTKWAQCQEVLRRWEQGEPNRSVVTLALDSLSTDGRSRKMTNGGWTLPDSNTRALGMVGLLCWVGAKWLLWWLPTVGSRSYLSLQNPFKKPLLVPQSCYTVHFCPIDSDRYYHFHSQPDTLERESCLPQCTGKCPYSWLLEPHFWCA